MPTAGEDLSQVASSSKTGVSAVCTNGFSCPTESGQLRSEIRPVFGILDDRIREMFNLFGQHYRHVSYRRFEDDLKSKDFVILLTGPDGSLCGFSTLAVMEIYLNGTKYRALFSGDTIIDPNHWGDLSLSQAFIQLTARVKKQAPEHPLYWFLIVKGHRTYRYLPAFFHEFHPNHSNTISHHARQLMDALAVKRFGEDYDPKAGVIRFATPRGQLCSKLAAIPPKDQNNPHVQYFLEKNPEFAKGEELVCLAEISPQNIRPFARRIFAAEMKK